MSHSKSHPSSQSRMSMAASVERQRHLIGIVTVDFENDTLSKSSLGMKSYKVRFTWQQGVACAASSISRTNRVDQSRCLAIVIP